MSTLSGYHDRTIFSVDWSKHNLIATGKIWFDLSEFLFPKNQLVHLVHLLSWSSHKCLAKVLPLALAGIVVSRDNILVIDAGSQDNGVRVFSVSLPEKVTEQTSRGSPVLDLLHHKASAHTSDVNCVRWHPIKPHLLASTSDDNSLRIWDVSLPEKI